MKNKHN